MNRFSPLAGIRYVETLWVLCLIFKGCFSPLAGIRYVETQKRVAFPVELLGFSPLAGIRYVETFFTNAKIS